MDTYSVKDLLVQSFSNIDFPSQYITTMNTPGLEDVGLTSFYEAFCKKTTLRLRKVEILFLHLQQF